MDCSFAMPSAVRVLRQGLAVLLALAVLAVSSPARAEDGIGANLDGRWSTGKKVAFYTLTGIVLVGTGAMIFTMVKADDAHARLNEEFPRKPNDPRVVDCTSPAQCAELRSASDDREAWRDGTRIAAFVTGGALLGAGLVAALWPSERSVRVAPVAYGPGAGIGVGGTF